MPHVVIIGAYGSAGVAVAERLADADVELTLIDNGDPGGGLCILRGCMPSKEVLSAAAHRYGARHDDRLDGPIPDLDLDAVVETKNEHTSAFAAHRRAAVHDLAEAESVTFDHERAQFVDDRTVRIGDREIEADYVVIATGSTVNVPALPGIEFVDYVTSRDVLDATALPDSGIVMGFGYVGLELAPYLAEAGVDLTVIEHDARPIDEADQPFGESLLDLYREEWGIEILTETTEERVEPTEDGGVRLHTDRADDHSVIEADELFLFTGRRPAVDDLGLEATSITQEPGWVDSMMRARDDDRTFVVGDANGHEPILHVAKEQGQVAAENILRDVRNEPLQPYENTHHHVIFSGLGVYPFARVGDSAATADGDPIVVTREASDDGVFRVKAVPHGLARLVVDGDDGTVLGFQGLHHHADTMAKLLQVSIANDLTVHEIPDRAYHPTLPEILDGLVREAKDRL